MEQNDIETQDLCELCIIEKKKLSEKIDISKEASNGNENQLTRDEDSEELN